MPGPPASHPHYPGRLDGVIPLHHGLEPSHESAIGMSSHARRRWETSTALILNTNLRGVFLAFKYQIPHLYEGVICDGEPGSSRREWRPPSGRRSPVRSRPHKQGPASVVQAWPRSLHRRAPGWVAAASAACRRPCRPRWLSQSASSLWPWALPLPAKTRAMAAARCVCPAWCTSRDGSTSRCSGRWSPSSGGGRCRRPASGTRGFRGDI